VGQAKNDQNIRNNLDVVNIGRQNEFANEQNRLRNEGLTDSSLVTYGGNLKQPFGIDDNILSRADALAEISGDNKYAAQLRGDRDNRGQGDSAFSRNDTKIAEMKAKSQEMRAKVIEAEAQVPQAMAEAFRSGNLGIMDYYKMAHFLPYVGEYNITCTVYDSFNYQSKVIKNSLVKVDPIQIDINAWTRYRENENYLWDQTVRNWDSYESIWEYPAEGKTIQELTNRIPPEVLEFSTYGNNSQGTQDMLVKVPINPIGASGNIVLQQAVYSINKSYSVYISGNQYGFVQIFTNQPHNFEDGSLVFITGSSPQINGSWNVTIPSGSTGYSFEIPVVLDSSVDGTVNGMYPVSPGPTSNYISSSYYPNQKVTGGGDISISVNGRVIGATSAGASLQSTVNSIIEVVNSVYTQPDYFAGSTAPNAIPATLNILANTDSGNVGNGDVLTAIVTGSLSLVSIDSTLSGGGTSGTQYITWNENYGSFPDENLRYWGTQNLNWDSIPTSTWDEAYAHGWYDFEYENGWLGGFEIHSIKVGDNIKVSTGNETFPFPVGVTFSATGGVTGPTGYITLGGAVSELNSSTEPHIANFYYRVTPYGSDDLLTTNGPVQTSFSIFGATAGGYSSPPTVPGAPPELIVSFTYATGP
jgi:hypothetical protein